ncbi:hypothetical protein L0F63_000446 [Massospora cicadina]|nr:hypothetical protein L0F63_000446 [Massospora cicadina]
MSNQNIESLIKSYNEIRGKSNTNEADQKFNGEKHQVMKDLRIHFGKEGTDATEIIKALGKPDRMERHIPELVRQDIVKQSGSETDAARIAGGEMAPLALGPGPFIGTGASGSDSSESYYMTYNWRGNHDYMYFKVDAQTEKVLSSGWYNALD